MAYYNVTSNWRLQKRYEFQRVFRQGRLYEGKLCNVYVLKAHTGGPARAGFIVTKKLGKSATRNRIRRLLREAFRLHKDELIAGLEMVIVAKQCSAKKALKLKDVEADFLSICTAAGGVRKCNLTVENS